MTDNDRPMCDCPEPCACYAEGYAHGKEKARFGVRTVLVMELARCEYVQRRENFIAVGNSGTDKTHVALALRQAQEGLDACQRGMSVGFATAAVLVHELLEAQDERRLLNLQRQLLPA